jgi:dTDP-4-dehydrorhamnose reductase
MSPRSRIASARIGPHNLAVAAQASDARLLHISTDFVFDGSASTPYRPDSRPNPQNTYGKTKLGGELAIQRTLCARSVVLRTAWVYAAEGNNFVRTMLRLMASKGQVRVVCDQVGTPTAASSLANVIWALAARPDISGIHHWTDAGSAPRRGSCAADCNRGVPDPRPTAELQRSEPQVAVVGAGHSRSALAQPSAHRTAGHPEGKIANA